MKAIYILLEICIIVVGSQDIPCNERLMEFGPVCVCNSSICDTISRPTPPLAGQYYWYVTSLNSPGFTKTTGAFTPNHLSGNATINLRVNHQAIYQEILGFGGSFTDTSGLLLQSLPEEAQDKFMNSYFGPHGLEYSLGRVPIAASDFSTHLYTYDDVPYDSELNHFSLRPEDYQYKIPVIQKAKALSPHDLKLIGCSFEAPSWMKKNNDTPVGYIRDEYWETWAKYHIKFLDAYADNDIKFWLISGGNEIMLGLLTQGLLNLGTQAWAYDHMFWVKKYLAPLLATSNHTDVEFIILDDMKLFSQYWMSRFMADPVTRKVTTGVAIHWYCDWFMPEAVRNKMSDDLHSLYPEKLILYTESSVNTVIFGGQPVELGSWHRGALYAFSIIENLNHWASTYIDWNLALDLEGGPWLNLPIDAAIIVNSTGDEFYKNPIFYVMGHFSKFIPPGAKRIGVESNNSAEAEESSFNPEILKHFFTRKDNKISDPTPSSTPPPPPPPIPPPTVPQRVSFVATDNPDNSTTIIVFNSFDYAVDITIEDDLSGSISATLTPQSINTFLYWKAS